MEHRVHEPKSETTGTAKRRTQFDMIEEPEKGWRTRHVKSATTFDAPPVWHVELVRESDGITVTFANESLFTAWARATEQAHMMTIGLLKDAQKPGA